MYGEPDIVQIDHIFSLEIGWGPVILSARLSVLHLIGFLVNFNHDTEIELLAKKWSNSEAHAATDLVQHLWVCLARHYGLVLRDRYAKWPIAATANQLRAGGIIMTLFLFSSCSIEPEPRI